MRGKVASLIAGLAGTAVALGVAVAAPLDTTITAKPPPFTNSDAATFAFTNETDPIEFRCRLDTGAEETCDSGKTYTGLSEGGHTFTVYGRRPGGGGDPGAAQSYSWTVDLTPPDTILDSGPPAATKDAGVSFVFHSEANAVFECSLNGAPFAACTSPRTFTGLGDGTRNFKIRAKDQAGNTDISPVDVTWSVDTTPPETTITKAPAGISSSQVVEFAATEPGTAECSVNGGAFAPCTSPNGVSAPDGPVSLAVRALDALGNVDPTPAVAAWMLDRSAPLSPLIEIEEDVSRPKSTNTKAKPAQRGTALFRTAPFQKARKLRVRWGNRDPGAVAFYDVSWKVWQPPQSSAPTGGPPWAQPKDPWKPLKLKTTATTATLTVDHDTSLCAVASATDPAGHQSAGAVTCTTVPRKATTLAASPAWSDHTGDGYFLGQFARGKVPYLRMNVAASLPTQYVRRVALLATKCASCGRVRVVMKAGSSPNVAGGKVAFDKTINLASSRTQKRQLILVHKFAPPVKPGADPISKLVGGLYDKLPIADRSWLFVFPLKHNEARIEAIGVSPY